MKLILAIITALFFAALLALSCGHLQAQPAALPGLTRIQTTLVDDDTTHCAVAHSHNQKVLWNEDGIFLSYSKTRAEGRPYMRGTWRLMRSTNGGASFTLLHEGRDGCICPVIENLDDALALAFSNQDTGSTTYYHFARPIGSSAPAHVEIPNTNPKLNGGKITMFYDCARGQVYWLPKPNRLTVFKPDGRIIAQTDIFADGPTAHVEYPHLRLDERGTLHAAWTTASNGRYFYPSMHYARSPDGGKTWQTMNGTPLRTPFVSDVSGPTDLLKLKDEMQVNTWLQNIAVRGGKLHLVYWAHRPLDRFHYMRYNLATGTREVDVHPKGDKLQPKTLQGCLLADPAYPGSTIYYVTSVFFEKKQHLCCVASDDDGNTWYDYALTAAPIEGNPVNIGGCRTMTPDHCLIGSFVDMRDRGQGNRVMFYRIQLGHSRAELLAVEANTLRFGKTRGQPTHVRFRSGTDAWSEWMKIDSTVPITRSKPPTHYQLRSRLEVESEPLPVAVRSTDNGSP